MIPRRPSRALARAAVRPQLDTRWLALAAAAFALLAAVAGLR